MPDFTLYSPTDGSHVQATTMVVADTIAYQDQATTNYNTTSDPFGDGAGRNFRIGKDSGGDLYTGFVRVTLPAAPRKTTATGTIINDASLKIKKITLHMKCRGFSGSSGSKKVLAFAPLVLTPDNVDFTGLTYNTYDGTNLWGTAGALEDGDRDGSTDYGSGVAGVVAMKQIAVGWNEITLQNVSTTGPAAKNGLGLDWGNTVDLVLFGRSGTFFNATNNYGEFHSLEDSTAANKPYVTVTYEDLAPTKPEITVTADSKDFLHAHIGFSSRPTDTDLTQFVGVHRSGGTDPVYATDHTDSTNYGKALTDTGKETYHGYNDLYNAGIASTTYFPGLSSLAGTSNKVVFYSEDQNNAGSEDDSTKGNVVEIKRYLPYTEEDFTDANIAKSCSVNWILVGKATAGSNAAFLTDTTAGADTPWLRGQFLKNNVEVGDKIWNDNDGKYATVSGVTNTTVSGTLSASGNWNTNDVYQIIRKVDVGEKVTLTVRSTYVDGLKFDKIGVDWTNTVEADAIADTPITSIADYDIIDLDSSKTEHTVSFRYSTPGTYYPSFFFVDSTTGFRTALAQMGMHTGAAGNVRLTATEAALVVEQPAPVPRLTSSKAMGESANVALDRGSAVVYSGANSTAAGSNAYIKKYKWLGEYASGQILTQGCLDIDNTPLINESKKLYMRCNTAGYNATVFTIYGLVSFQGDNATSVKDTDTSFSHYRYVKATVSPGTAKYLKHDTGSAFGTAAVLSGTAEQMYFKQVDFVYATTKSGTSGTEECYQLLAADSDNDGTIDANGTLDTSTICKRLVIDSNNGSPGYKWGGLCTVTGSSNITFTKNSGADEIESTAIDFIAAGFGPGDTITIEDSSNDGVYTIQKVEKVSSTYSIYLNEELSVTEASTSATIFTTQPAISVAAGQAGTPKISLNVTDNLGTDGTEAVNIYTTFRDQTYLDLNASADSGYIAIQNASLTRSGGISAAMPLGERRYPPGAAHTKHGLPKMSMTVRVVDSTGFNRMYRLLNNSYNYAVYQHHDTTFASWVKYRLKMESFTVNRDPQNLQHQVINLSFFIVGEEV